MLFRKTKFHKYVVTRLPRLPPTVFRILLIPIMTLFRPLPEESESRLLVGMIRPGDIVVEVGANIGGTTRMLSTLVGSGGQVFTLEPNPLILTLLLTVVKSLTNVRVIAAGAADSDRFSKLTISTVDDHAATLLQPFSGKRVWKEVQVRLFRIDTLVKAQVIPRVDVLVVDAEGAEYSVLTGAESALPSIREVIVEMHKSYDFGIEEKIDGFLKGFGFNKTSRIIDYADRSGVALVVVVGYRKSRAP